MRKSKSKWFTKNKKRNYNPWLFLVGFLSFVCVFGVALLFLSVSILSQQNYERSISQQLQKPSIRVPQTGKYAVSDEKFKDMNEKWAGWPNSDERLVYSQAPESFPRPTSILSNWKPLKEQCEVEEVNNLYDFADYVQDRVIKENCKKPDSLGSFVCKLQCSEEEPELEFSMRFAHTTNYRIDTLARMCKDHTIQVIIWILDNNIKYRVCDRDGKLVGKSVFTSIARTLKVATCMTNLPDVIFGMGVSDFAVPMSEPVQNAAPGLMQPMPATIRLVGADSIPTILFPTPSYLRATTHCRLNDGGDIRKWSQVCRKRVPSLPFEDRKPVVFWRGSGTGLPMQVDGVIDFLPRPAAVRKLWGKKGFDVAFVGEPNPSTKHLEFGKQYYELTKPRVDALDMLNHRYLLHMDGHTASWGGTLKLMSGSLVLWHPSQFTFREFHYRLLEPWKHYIPVSRDFSNLEEIYGWLTSPEGEGFAAAVASQSQKLFSTRLKPSDTYCYVVRTLTTLSEQQKSSPTETALGEAGLDVHSFAPIDDFL